MNEDNTKLYINGTPVGFCSGVNFTISNVESEDEEQLTDTNPWEPKSLGITWDIDHDVKVSDVLFPDEKELEKYKDVRIIALDMNGEEHDMGMMTEQSIKTKYHHIPRKMKKALKKRYGADWRLHHPDAYSEICYTCRR